MVSPYRYRKENSDNPSDWTSDGDYSIPDAVSDYNNKHYKESGGCPSCGSKRSKSITEYGINYSLCKNCGKRYI